MDSVIDLDRHRAPRVPSPLRWIAGGAYWIAHHRDEVTRRPRCGAPGSLILADRDVPECDACKAAAG